MASAAGMNFKARHRRPVAERFHDRYKKSEGGCWQWLASGTSEGYGRIESGGRKILAHRLSFVLHVLAERRRQVEAEGWTATHDDQHRSGELAVAAVCYAIYIDSEPPPMWPFDPTWWRPAGDRRNLVKAAALLLAEIERLDRAAAQEPKP